MKSKNVIVLLFTIFLILSKASFAMDNIPSEDIDIEIYRVDLDKDGVEERIEVIREALTPAYISYYVYDPITEEILFSKENIYRAIIDIGFNSFIEKLPIFNDENFGRDNSYIEKEYILEDKNMLCISSRTKFRIDSIEEERLATSSTYYTNPSRSEIEAILEEVALCKGIPPTILKAIAYTESNYRQFQDGKALLSFDGVSWGIMQVTPKFYPDLDIDRLKYDIRYNIEAGADILLGKWGYGFSTNPLIPKIGTGDMRVLENWYFAIWAYNGLSQSNNPNMIPYKHSTWTQYEAYQDKVLRHAKEILGQDILAIEKELLPRTGTADPKVHYDELVDSTKDKYRLFVVGQMVKVNAPSGLKLRDAKMNAIKTISNGEDLRIIGDPILYDGYYRYKVEEVYDDGSIGKIGWVGGNWIIANDRLNKGILVWQRRKDIDNHKPWIIEFNQSVDMASIAEDTIYIEDSNQKKIGIDVDFENEDYKALKIVPLSQYNSGEGYTLWIKDLKTNNGSRLMEYIKMSFLVQ